MDAKEVKTAICDQCDATTVVNPASLLTKYQCGECDEIYDTKKEADECCNEF